MTTAPPPVNRTQAAALLAAESAVLAANARLRYVNATRALSELETADPRRPTAVAELVTSMTTYATASALSATADRRWKRTQRPPVPVSSPATGQSTTPTSGPGL